MDEFEICLLPDWEEVELDEEDKAEGAYYAAKCVDQDAVLIVMAMDLTEGYTQEEIEAELAEGNFRSPCWRLPKKTLKLSRAIP